MAASCLARARLATEISAAELALFLLSKSATMTAIPMRVCLRWAAAGLALATLPCLAERINQQGRILGSAPVVTNSILFNTPQADAILSAMQLFPVTSAWNEDISRRPVLANSDAMIAQIISELSSSRRTLRPFQEMNFALVPDSQPLVPIAFVYYPGESDPSPYPIPTNLPIETWPTGTSGLTLQQWQQDTNNIGGDRHALIVQPGNGFLWETWQAKLVGTNWQASNGAKFDLNSNALRPAGWTSGDAAGLPMFPALVRYDECERGMVEHACRLVVKHTRAQYLYPANHYASVPYTNGVNFPAMGQRLRLKSSFVIPSAWTKQEKAVLLGLKKYGALVADNGNFFSISITPDDRWPAGAFDHLSTIGITNFEVIQTTGATEGPRSPGAPRASAGPPQSVAPGTPLTLQGCVTCTGAWPATAWSLYSGPGTVTFGNASQTNTTASFSAPGVYTLLLSADDSVHAVAYDAVVITVTSNLKVSIAPSGGSLSLGWTGGSPPYTVECADTPAPLSWNTLLTTNGQGVLLPGTSNIGFFRVRSQ
jgi:hypothetical protein